MFKKQKCCAFCKKELGESYFLFCDNHLQAKYFDCPDGSDNAFCDQNCACGALMLEEMPNAQEYKGICECGTPVEYCRCSNTLLLVMHDLSQRGFNGFGEDAIKASLSVYRSHNGRGDIEDIADFIEDDLSSEEGG